MDLCLETFSVSFSSGHSHGNWSMVKADLRINILYLHNGSNDSMFVASLITTEHLASLSWTCYYQKNQSDSPQKGQWSFNVWNNAPWTLDMCVTCTLIFHNLFDSDNIPNIIWKCQQHRPLGFSVIIPDAAFSSRDMCNGTILFWFYEHSLDIHNRHTPIFGSSFFFFFYAHIW